MVALGVVQKRGMSREDADDVIRTMAKYDDFFVNIMMNEELGLQVRVIVFKTASLEIQQKIFFVFRRLPCIITFSVQVKDSKNHFLMTWSKVGMFHREDSLVCILGLDLLRTGRRSAVG